MSRWPALLFAIVGGALIAFAIVAVGSIVLMGVLWLFVFGDDSWPVWVNRSLDVALPVVGLALWALASWILFLRLKRD